MIRTVEIKLYPTPAQAETLGVWMGSCCWVYNRALEQRIKSYKRRGTTATFYDQCSMLTHWRVQMTSLKSVPLEFERDALRRVDRGFKGFFRRLKAGQKPGFPRFKSSVRYNSMECLASNNYIHSGNFTRIPKLGLVKFRGGSQSFLGTQKLLRIIRRVSGWFAQIVIDDGNPTPPKQLIGLRTGIDVGLASFVTLSNGTKIDNPRWAKKSEKKLRSSHRRLSRTKKKSRNRKKSIDRLKRVYEKITAQRKDFCHQQSRLLVNKFDLIAIEKLDINSMTRKSRYAKSILDAGWRIFLNQLKYKAENAGKTVVEVDARKTSQTCPSCGEIKKKQIWERIHECSCGLICDRDHASARIILSRALASRRGLSPVEELISASEMVSEVSRSCETGSLSG